MLLQDPENAMEMELSANLLPANNSSAFLFQTVRNNGEIQVWSLEDGSLAGSMSLGVEASTLACSPLAPIVVVGTTSGFIFVVDLTEPERGRIIHRTRAYTRPVTRAV